jgi:predicted nuclease of predicted toxin-antitoxin system
MWLLDVNMPKKLVAVLGEFGVEAATAESRGWRGFTNGELVEAAAGAGFTCILTRDRLFSESAAGMFSRFPRFCVVLVTLPQLRGAQFLEQFRFSWQRNPIRPEPGMLIRWPAT